MAVGWKSDKGQAIGVGLCESLEGLGGTGGAWPKRAIPVAGRRAAYGIMKLRAPAFQDCSW